jgi:hypothetical protein
MPIVVAPGATSPSLEATTCSTSTEGLSSDGTCSICVFTDCDGLDDDTAHASVGTPGFPLGFGRRVATCTLGTRFAVSATPATMDNVLPLSSINYDIQWRGFWLLVVVLDLFDSVQEMTITLRVVDVTQSQLVKEELLQKSTVNTLGFEDIFEGATRLDVGDRSGVFDVTLKRGHEYELQFVLRVESSSNLASIVDIDYGSQPLDLGAKWTALTVTAGPDTTQSIANLETLTLEQNLKTRNALAALYLPAEFGGRLEEVIDYVELLDQRSMDAGFAPTSAQAFLEGARSQMLLGNYKLAYDKAARAYQLLTASDF